MQQVQDKLEFNIDTPSDDELAQLFDEYERSPAPVKKTSKSKNAAKRARRAARYTVNYK